VELKLRWPEGVCRSSILPTTTMPGGDVPPRHCGVVGVGFPPANRPVAGCTAYQPLCRKPVEDVTPGRVVNGSMSLLCVTLAGMRCPCQRDVGE